MKTELRRAGTEPARTQRMVYLMRRRVTLVGLGPSEDELTDADIFESDGCAKRVPVTVPPPPPAQQDGRYSMVVPRDSGVRPAVRAPRPAIRRVASR